MPPPAAGEHCLFVAELGHPDAERLAAEGQLVISEAGGAAGLDVLDAGYHLLGDADFLEAHRPQRVIVLGRPTLHRPVTALLTDPAVRVDMVARGSGWRGLAGNVRQVGDRLGDGAVPATDDWAESWRAANGVARQAVGKVLDDAPLTSSPALARELVAGLDDGAAIVVGSSQPARDLSLGTAARRALRVRANRGAAGIDGLVSTALGTALASGAATVGYLGDLTLLHDQNGLVLGPDEPRPDLTLVVSNNDGGGIFATLEPGAPQHDAVFERVFGTPHGVDFAALAAANHLRYSAPTTRLELAQALRAEPGIRLVEVRTDRRMLRAHLADLRGEVRQALSQDS